MSVEELMEQLRQQDVFSFKDVSFAIVETNGKLSVMKKPEKDTPTVGDLGLTCDDNGIEAVVISDGSLSESALKLCKADEQLVGNILDKKGLRKSDVFLMTMDKTHAYSIIKKEGAT